MLGRSADEAGTECGRHPIRIGCSIRYLAHYPQFIRRAVGKMHTQINRVIAALQPSCVFLISLALTACFALGGKRS